MDKLSESSTTPVRVGDMLLGSSITSAASACKLDEGRQAAGAGLEEPRPDLLLLDAGAGRQGARLHGDRRSLPPRSRRRCTASRSRPARNCGARPKVGKYHAALLRTGDDKLLMLEDAGNLVLLDPDPKEYRELARAKVCGDTWAHPALANGRLYVRDDKELVCVELK